MHYRPVVRATRGQSVVAGFALFASFVYAAALPLWEGFDEPFHYSYVQWLAVHHELPVLGKTTLSQEIWESMRLTPLSHIVQRGVSEFTSFSAFRALPEGERAKRRRALQLLDPRLRYVNSGSLNYESQHAPAAYMVLALVDTFAAEIQLRQRVLLLRCAAGAIGMMASVIGLLRLARRLMPDAYAYAAVFCGVTSQMYLATVSRISNDFLAIPLYVWTLVFLTEWDSESCGARDIRFFMSALCVALGLVTKAWFLALLPPALAVVFLASKDRVRTILLWLTPVLLFAGPLLVRNVILYGSLSGMVEANKGVGFLTVVRSGTSVNWIRSIAYMSRAAIWTGNSSFTAFSQRTIGIVQAMLAAGMLAFLVLPELWRRAKTCRVILLCGFFYALAIAYDTVITFVDTAGVSQGASPWYLAPLWITAVLIFFVSASEIRHPLGVYAARALVAVSTYILGATFVFKLIPYYSGYEGRAGLQPLLDWYVTKSQQDMQGVFLVPPGLLLAAVATLILGAAGFAWRLAKACTHKRDSRFLLDATP